MCFSFLLNRFTFFSKQVIPMLWMKSQIYRNALQFETDTVYSIEMFILPREKIVFHIWTDTIRLKSYVFIGLFPYHVIKVNSVHYMVYTFSNAGFRAMIIKTYNPMYFWYSILLCFYLFGFTRFSEFAWILDSLIWKSNSLRSLSFAFKKWFYFP